MPLERRKQGDVQCTEDHARTDDEVIVKCALTEEEEGTPDGPRDPEVMHADEEEEGDQDGRTCSSIPCSALCTDTRFSCRWDLLVVCP